MSAGVVGSTRVHKNKSAQRPLAKSRQIVSHSVVCLLSFFAGTIWGGHACLESLDSIEPLPKTGTARTVENVAPETNVRLWSSNGGFPVETSALGFQNESRYMSAWQRQNPVDNGGLREGKCGTKKRSRKRRIPESMKRIADGVARTSKDEFIKLYDFGIPYDRPQKDMEDVLLLYQTERALPNKLRETAVWDTEDDIPHIDASQATENCDQMNVLLTKLPDNNPQCLAIMANYQSYHIQRWMRLPEVGGGLNRREPLRLVSRGDAGNGRRSYKPPREEDILATFDMLRTYLERLDDVLARLKPVADRVARNNTIIVMTCNFGQSELLMNFACSAKARGFDLRNVLVFVTDVETKEIVEGLGLAAFFDEKTSEKIPTEAARRYGDQRFVAMMFAKVVCVQLISLLGFDLLFQDVDIVWYKDPIPFFHNETSSIKHFDVYFQDDGAHSLRYAPFSANSGFYFARNNDRTRYLFTSLLYAQDIIRRTESHQQALIALLNEQSSLFGLKVKVLNRDENDFPGGWHYHHSGMSPLMRNLVDGNIKPYIFHMSWTNNKVNKIKFFQQMGDWFVEEKCVAKSLHMIGENKSLSSSCCLVAPLVKCHYRDKPSKIPCHDAQPIDKGRKSWWKQWK